MKVYAGSASITMTLSRNTPAIYNTSVEKSITGADAAIHMDTTISANDTVSANVISLTGVNVSDSVSFRGTTGFTAKSAPYKSGYGTAGVKYKLKATLLASSSSSSLTVKMYFIP